MRLPGDELGLVASLRGAPLPVVKSITNDMRVPADAEWVLEGYLDERGLSSSPKALTASSSATTAASRTIRSSMSPRSPAAATRCSRPPPSAAAAMSRTDTAQLARAAHRGDDLARARDRDPRAASRSMRRLDRRHLQRARRHAPARPGRGAQRHRRGASARSPTSRTCSWSIPTSTSSPTSRWNGRWRRGFSPTAISSSRSGLRTLPLDPSLARRCARRQGRLRPARPVPRRGCRGLRKASKRKFRSRRDLTAARFASIEAALADGPKFFAELMAADGSDDGREIVLGAGEAGRGRPAHSQRCGWPV